MVMWFGNPMPDYAEGVDENYHLPIKCTDKNCDGCNFCAGALYACSVCNGGEITMPSHCPGRKMTIEEQDEVSAMRLDFHNNRWWVPKSVEKKQSK